jgi:phosphatidylglycerophosphate synthase
MNLHRSGKTPEWESVAIAERNVWQRTAAKTGSLVAPGNIITLGGFGLVVAGLSDMVHGNKKTGFLKIAAGRGADMLDGAVANYTGTKSPIGEGLDAATDKISMLLALPVLAKTGELPKPVSALLALRDTAIASVSLVAKKRERELHPSEYGKRATFEQWLAVAFYASSNMLAEAGHNTPARALRYLGHTALGVMALESTVAISDYAQQTFIPVNLALQIPSIEKE